MPKFKTIDEAHSAFETANAHLKAAEEKNVALTAELNLAIAKADADLQNAVQLATEDLQKQIEELMAENSQLRSVQPVVVNGEVEVINFNEFDLKVTPAPTEEVPNPKPTAVTYRWRSAGHGMITIPGGSNFTPDEVMASENKEARLLALVTEHPSLFEEVIK